MTSTITRTILAYIYTIHSSAFYDKLTQTTLISVWIPEIANCQSEGKVREPDITVYLSAYSGFKTLDQENGKLGMEGEIVSTPHVTPAKAALGTKSQPCGKWDTPLGAMGPRHINLG
ncbi:hypothetical protein BDV35DRAFT_380511 [Aspergillus flavus]|uniref:DNA, SC138 n=2 Tax=Aspergillus subgen. Circumdati TaxID=2720871 RepID=Q2U1R7_ASPOR|nr:unnamed protein product [Aspergillus oryzae RIB40]KAB8246588.1 hypothetical protein BDV35DRAFT_380511 [Aspergillus flavus]BAE64498.1 unnamed protein product [Aspergillus oryzae RIB40]